MADANRARSARVTALNSAYARYTPSSRLFSAYLVANNPSAASTRHSANILDHRPSPVPSFPSSSFDPSIPGGRVHPRSIVRRAGQSAPKSAQFHHNIPCTVRWSNRDNLTVDSFFFVRKFQVAVGSVTALACRYEFDRSVVPISVTFHHCRTSWESAARSSAKLFIHTLGETRRYTTYFLSTSPSRSARSSDSKESERSVVAMVQT